MHKNACEMYNHNFQFFMYSASNLQKRVFTNKVHRVQSTWGTDYTRYRLHSVQSTLGI